jgi:hypothetical protein
MYQVFFKDYPLHDPRSAELQLRDPDVHLAVDEAGEMSFTIDGDHPHVGRLTRLNGVVKLTAAGRAIFRGRIRKDAADFNLSRRIDVEGLFACLNDSIIPPFDFPGDFAEDAAYQTAAESGNVIRFFMEWVLTEHNSQVGPDQQIRLGDVTVTDPNNYISRSSSDYLSAMDVVKKKLRDILGGYLVPDYSGDVTVLHYYADLPLTNVQTVEFGENLLDLAVDVEAADTYTAILPIGADGLTIESLPDGEISPGVWKSGRIIYSVSAETAVGGRITRAVAYDDVTLATNLQNKAVVELETNGVKHVQTISVKAADLGGVDGVPRFVVGRYVRFNSPPHGFADAYPLMVLEPNINDPADTEITLGATVKTLADLANKNQSALAEGRDKLQIVMNQQKTDLDQQKADLGKQKADLDKQKAELGQQKAELGQQKAELDQQKAELDQQKADLETAVKTTQSQITSAIQTCEQIIFSALTDYAKTSDLNSFRQTVESQFAITADEIAARFTETTEHIVDVDGDLQRTVETLAKHFEFNLDGLVIKAGKNAMTLTLDNDLIVFKKNGQTFGWWDGVDFHTGNIVIDVTERAQFGNFAFVPRSNGSLSFLKVGG